MVVGLDINSVRSSYVRDKPRNSLYGVLGGVETEAKGVDTAVELADATTTNTEAQKNDWGRMRTESSSAE